nr:hypothetical protein [Candidatus Woesearchaeota archaeon]
MLKKFLVIFFLFLFAMQFVLAIDTEIKIKTPEFTEIHLTILDPDADFSAYGIFKQTSNAYGDATFVYSGEELIFDLMVVLKKADKTISSEKYRENYIAGDPIYLEIIPSGYEIKETPAISGTNGGSVEGADITNLTETNITESNQTTDETNLTSNETLTEEKSGFLGAFLDFGKKDKTEKTDEKSGSSFKGLYIIGALALFFAIGFFIFKSYKTPTPRKIKVTKLSETQPKAFDSKNVNELISDATGRIKEAQKEIDILKKYKG